MEQPPFMWRGADAVADYVDWQTQEQAKRDEALIAAEVCPVVIVDDE